MHARVNLEAGETVPTTLDFSPEQPVTLGRGRDNTIVLKDELASRLHAKIYFEDGRWHLRDFGLNGTRVDGTRVNGAVELTDGKKIKIGEVVLRFVTDLKAGAAAPPPAPAVTQPAAPTAPATMSGSIPGALMSRSRYPTENVHAGTKVHEMPGARVPQGEASHEPATNHLRMDELTALCKFMTQAVETRTPHDLITLALRAILHQTTAKLVGYLGLDPEDPAPRVVVPEASPMDSALSRRLTAQVQKHGKMVWLFPELTAAHPPTDSLAQFSDAICIPLKASGAAFAALHVYRSTPAFTERDVKFTEAVAGFLAPGLEIHRNRRTLEAENYRLRIHAPAADDILGGSTAIMNLRQQILKAAPQPFTVLVHGESGSGKELVALALHRNSRRADGPLVVVNCAAIAPSLLEAELFGYKKGAFTGADRDHPGLFQQADDGTLFLDEIGELSLDCQARLLRVIEGKAFRPVGATTDVKVDVRIVAATHRDLEKEAKAGRFRQDLLFRLRVIPIRVPPLREHPEDIPELAGYFLSRVSAECRRNFRLTATAMRKLQAFPWPGNVRQLRAAIESAAVMSESDVIDGETLPLTGASEMASLPAAPAKAVDAPTSLDMDEIETWAIRKALRQTGGNVSHAAKLLGMSRDTLHTKIKKKNIDRDALVTTPAPLGSAKGE
ncbi:two sigma54 fis family transcriptional regulator : Sigma54 specific transcriptional regulator, Fis family OS=Pirellula staleyi (strain ATCC 27377 / DSM 6068 / ICPB 4128) GN=Psta_4161 PE=4 SV=1: FHA: Sigma54_activat: HTH_8 [Gemmataceae bacterium]|nr:two sigma54 fis family transcriptional regulator : Sigma54 specific transcriptional regulator, Fis family OS=Pirellula staleyi (strain ATCC 27377 / DSM 6068 / ICPB 4128) GN=Psta_4161 PE=4 SV=1: FHA: Sigma54_activat: HTH_8 [Gemmataceae bacterium]VTT98243.1 two sigma54 fis family transcriptional regulator : Sigma54 specific transcriptional regulator, Fis family OS=Pirellula staleyi (strain ATCC 27377 / DSM 6068 / ICPB 4128) GN=Psta_4161 PE=4 SV=1: FHA: Sigma54_activat: HTH_8 [Gemmataceae bacteriu